MKETFVKLCVLEVGGFRMGKNNIAPGAVNGDVPIVMPIRCYLIEHPTEGYILVDTGQNYDMADDVAVGTKEDSVVNQLKKVGVTPDDIKYVIISHMHVDHVGEMTSFPNATFVIRREELKSAWWPECCERGYVYNQYKDTRGYKYIQPGDDEDFDLFMDGSIVLIDTKGHSRGHQSVIVNLEKEGKVVLVCDAASLKEVVDRNLLPGVCTNNWDAVHSIQKLHHYEDVGYKLFYMHDPDIKYKTAPEFYE